MPDLPQTSHIRLDLRGSVLHLWLDRPELRNALSQQMVREIAATFAAIADERSVRVVVVRGAGSAFCAGGDIKSMSVAHAAQPPGATDELKDNNRRFGAMLEAVNSAPQVVIAAVDGAAMGGGFGLACVADITIATADARFAMSEVTIGVVAAAIAPFVVQRIGLTAGAAPGGNGRASYRARGRRNRASRILRLPTPPRLKRPCATPATRFSSARPVRSRRPNG